VTRWLVAVVVLVVVIAGGAVFFWHPEPVDLHLAPGRTTHVPLGTAIVSAFAAGVLLAGFLGSLRAGTHGWRRWQTRRHARREAERSASTDRARELVWAGDYA